MSVHLLSPAGKRPQAASRDLIGRLFHVACLCGTWFGVIALAVLLGGILYQAWGWLDWQFLTSYHSFRPARAGVLAGLWGSMWLIFYTALFAVPVGVGAAVYLEEYAKGTWLTRLIQVNLANLAGVPSIVYGILGLTVFVRNFGLFGKQTHDVAIPLFVTTLHIPLPLGRSVLSGAFTLSLLVLPVIIIATQEALRAVPPSIRHASYALGATKWQTIRYQVLPAALPGISTGVILALSRAIGETAPLVLLGIPVFITSTPGEIESVADFARHPHGVLEAPFATFTALPMIIFKWIANPNAEFRHLAAAGCVVLLVLLLLLNAAALFVRQRFQKRIRW